MVSESIIKHLGATEPCTQPTDLCVEVGPLCKLGLSSDPLPGNETSLGNGFCAAGSKSGEVRLEGRWPTDRCDRRPRKKRGIWAHTETGTTCLLPGRNKAGAGSPSAPPEAAVWRLHLSFPPPERSVSAGHAPRGVALLLSPLSPQEMGTWPWGPSPLLRQTDRQTAGSLLDGAQGALACGGAQGTRDSPRVRDGFLWLFPEPRPAPSQPHPLSQPHLSPAAPPLTPVL